MKTEQKQHHYIPTCYSKNFANADRCIYLRDNWVGKVFSTRPEKTLKQRYLYTQPVHAEKRFDNAIENLFARTIEANWPRIVSSIEKREMLSDGDWSNFIQFMMALKVRVPNTIKGVIKLLRDSVLEVSDSVSPPASIFVDVYRKKFPERAPEPKFSDLVEAGIVALNIDPHCAVLSFANLLKYSGIIYRIPNAPVFLHNRTPIEFISSDNPVIFHDFTREIDDISPYSASSNLGQEIIFPISSRVSLLINASRRSKGQHVDTFSVNTVARINEKVSLYSDRYTFSSSEGALLETPAYGDRCPVPVLSKSIVGNGVVHRMGYDFGTPLKDKNEWQYDFAR